MPDWEAFVRQHLNLHGLTDERQSRIVRELAEQLEDFHQEMISQGLSNLEAHQAALAQVPDWGDFANRIRRADRAHVQPRVAAWGELMEESSRARGGNWTMLSDWVRDLRFAIRHLRKNKVHTLVSLVMLGLGIGANTAIFSVVNGVLLRPFPYPDADRLAVVSISWPEGRFWLSEKEVLLLRSQSTFFEGFGVFEETSVTLLGGQGAERVNVGLVSANALPLIGVAPVLGRFFTPDEELPGGPGVAIISHGLWQRHFGGSPDVLERRLRLDDPDSTRVVGVMPAGFQLTVSVNGDFYQNVDIWHPYQVDYQTADRGRNLLVLTRVNRGINWETAQAELDRIAAGFFADSAPQNTYRAFPLQQDTVSEVRAYLLLLLAATAFILIIACTNIANLTLASGATRQHELAIRTALGASRWRLVRQSLSESGVLAILGGGAGCLIAWLTIGLLPRLVNTTLPRLEAVQLDSMVLAVTMAVSVVCGLAFGLIPALRASHPQSESTLRQTGLGRKSAAPSRFFRRSLLIAEIAFSLMLLVGGTLIVRSFLNLQQEDPGFNPENTLIFTLSLPSARYESLEKRAEFFGSLEERIRDLSGVESVGANLILPFGRSLFKTSVTFISGEETVIQPVLYRPATPDYLQTLQARFLAGRNFTANEHRQAARVAVIDNILAEQVWPGEQAIGKQLNRTSADLADASVVIGVVENLRLTSLTGPREGQVFVPSSQMNLSSMSFLVRTSFSPTALLEPIRQEVARLDPNTPLYDVGTLNQTLASERAPQRLTSLLMVIFALMGLLLTVVGIYGVVSLMVAQRTHELGLRVALGATKTDIHRQVLASGLRLALAGTGLGLLGSLALSRTLTSLLYGISPLDTPTYLSGCAIVIAAVLGACLIPARRATRVDPLAALRFE